MAAERTLMAWLRTAMSLITFGYTVARLFPAFEGRSAEVSGPLGLWHATVTQDLGYYMVLLGTGALAVAASQHRAYCRKLRASNIEMPFSASLAVSWLMVLLGLMVFSSLALRL